MASAHQPQTTGQHNAPSAAPMYNPEDLRLRAIYADAYPHQIWFFVASFIFLVGVCQLASWIIGKLQYRRRADRPVAAGSLSRIPLAIVNLYRVVAFRSTVGIGSYTLNLAEVFCTVAYIVALFTWELVNSMLSFANMT